MLSPRLTPLLGEKPAEGLEMTDLHCRQPAERCHNPLQMQSRRQRQV